MKVIAYLLLLIVFDSIITQWYTGFMDDRKKTLAAISVIVGFLLLVALIVGVLVSGKKILSPVPEDDAIKIIFVSPTAIVSPALTATPTPSLKTTGTKTPTPTKKPTSTTTPEASKSATPTP